MEVETCASPKLAIELHDDKSSPLKFLEEAVTHGARKDYFSNINDDGTCTAFGVHKAAMVRQSYMEIKELIKSSWELSQQNRRAKCLAIIKGSSGVGKSVFLAYWIASCRRDGMKDFLLFHASKSIKDGTGRDDNNRVNCSLWLNGEKVVHGLFKNVEDDITERLSQVKMIIMDGCAMQYELTGFKGLVVLTASPSQYVKNLTDYIDDNKSYYMPPVSLEEAMKMANLLQVDEAIVKDNFDHMNGIARHLFYKGKAQEKVDSALESVDPKNILEMVSMQSSSKNQAHVAVHSLILWTPNTMDYCLPPSYTMVSRYAEDLVTKKLAREEIQDLRNMQRRLSSVTGASGYAGALFEAYAIRVLKGGDTFTIRSLDDGSEKRDLVFQKMSDDQIVELEDNALTSTSIPFEKLKGKPPRLLWPTKPLLLWPRTTNIPTFDCFYLHENETVYCLQMTISMDHDLKNSGARHAKKYFDGLLGEKKPQKYKALFVVPNSKEPEYEEQKFVSTGTTRVPDMSAFFEQWVMGLNA